MGVAEIQPRPVDSNELHPGPPSKYNSISFLLSFGVGAIFTMSFRLTVEYEPDRSLGEDTVSFVMEVKF